MSKFEQYVNEENDVEKSSYAKMEERVLDRWNNEGVFDQTLEKESPNGEFIFYEGPPTANGRPGIHHLETRVFKDAIPRYKTMQGYHVRRKAGWDTHGLPVELQVEKQLGLQSKKDIEEYGIKEFNKECKKSVWTYVNEWQDFTERMGFWLDLDNPYVTYHPDYMETLFWVVSEINKQGLLYKDYKVVPWCPRCGTALSSHELAQGYEDVKDISVTAKFELEDEPGTYVLAWTTTPWTLPGNVALAVGKDIEYVKFKVEGSESVPDGVYITAKDHLNEYKESEEYKKESNTLQLEELETIKGRDLVGKKYKPLFPYLKDLLPEDEQDKLENAYKIYSADFVTTDDGTGIVHTAVMYGQDDFELGSEIGLPKFHLVNDEGNFIEGTDFLEGAFVKDQNTDIAILKNLKERGLLFHKEKYEHSYPHCWRCKTPLIYYARDSWYVNMQEVKGKLIEENKQIGWEPQYIRDGRFGEWLNELKDWAISRERYWGTPLPVWESHDGDRIVVDSVDTLKQYTKTAGNTYMVLRHGEAEHNIAGIANCGDREKYGLTDTGKENTKQVANELAQGDTTPTVIYTSPFRRTRETAEIVASELGGVEVITDERLREYDFGDLDERPKKEFNEWREETPDYYTAYVSGSEESYYDAKRRVGEFLYELEQTHNNKAILIVGHGLTLETTQAVVEGAGPERGQEIKDNTNHDTSYYYTLQFVPLPVNDEYELDLHKPYIDNVILEKDGKEYHRTSEVMDVWFDSGCMPLAQDYYPFENKDYIVNTGYPADFIAEAIDQTRGWFYTLHAVGNLLGKGRAYNNVLCLGHIMDAEGKKMSKSKGNVVDPWRAMKQYGVDTLRFWMYSVNQPGEPKNFDEETVKEVQRKVFGLLDNVAKFYELYVGESTANSVQPTNSSNVLDQWIIGRLYETAELATKHLDKFQLLEPTRAIRAFIADLSQWYLRRSRGRIKDGDAEALVTTRYVLSETAKLLAPFAPFFADDLYSRVDGSKSSVHLAEWPVNENTVTGEELPSDAYREVIDTMTKTREIISNALLERDKAGLKVRQPLAKLTIPEQLGEGYRELIQDEVNIKEVETGSELALDTELTPELKEEGNARELIRQLQSMRKKQGLSPEDTINLGIDTDEAGQQLVEKFEGDIKETAGIKSFTFETNEGEPLSMGELSFKVVIQ